MQTGTRMDNVGYGVGVVGTRQGFFTKRYLIKHATAGWPPFSVMSAIELHLAVQNTGYNLVRFPPFAIQHARGWGHARTV